MIKFVFVFVLEFDMKKVVVSQGLVDCMVCVPRFEVAASVFGRGMVDVRFRTSHLGCQFWQYMLWKSMLTRCFDDKYKVKQPSYKDVTCCDEWLSFATFLEWVNKEVGYKGKPDGYQLDKDLIIKGNKIYSPEACSFVPRAVNQLLVDRAAARGEWPVGVCYNKRFAAYKATVSVFGKPVHLGLFQTAEGAHDAYVCAKEQHVRLVADIYRDLLHPTVHRNLLDWRVS